MSFPLPEVLELALIIPQVDLDPGCQFQRSTKGGGLYEKADQEV